MSPFLFWIFALLTLIFGAAVVINRNPVASALSLVVSFLGLAALFMSLNAYFIGIIQVLVYAGAVMVLFPNRRRSRLGGDGWCGAFEQTRASLV